MGARGLRQIQPWTARLDRAFPLLLAGSAATFLISSVTLFIHQELSENPALARSAFAMTLLICGLAQGVVARIFLRNASLRRSQLPGRAVFCRRLFVGLCLAYFLSPALAPRAIQASVFGTIAACWYTMLWLPLVEFRRVPEWCRALRSTRLCRWSAFGVTMTVAGLFMTECACRGYAIFTGHHVHTAFEPVPVLAAGQKWDGQPVNSQGFLGAEFTAQPRIGVYRIATVGGDAIVRESATRGVLDEIATSLPNLEIYNFGLPTIGLTEAQTLLRTELGKVQPDLVLLFLSADQELVRAPSGGAWNDLSESHLVRLASTLQQPAAINTSPTTASADRLIACRTPIDELTQRRWGDLESKLRGFAMYCRTNNLAFAIVLVPGEFQVRPALADDLRRRLGWDAQNVDLDLPQRRLQAFFAAEKCPMVDLLPQLRECEEFPYVRQSANWNPAGQGLVAATLTRWLHARYGSTIAAAEKRTLYR